MNQISRRIGFDDMERFLANTYNCLSGRSQVDFDKYGAYFDAVRPLLSPSLEKQLVFCLERFVYNENFDESLYLPYLERYVEPMLTAYATYNDRGFAAATMLDFVDMNNVIDFLSHCLLVNKRLSTICDEFERMGIEKNWLGCINVFNYMSEKDFWLNPSSRCRFGETSVVHSTVCVSTCSNLVNELDQRLDTSMGECSRQIERCTQKRTATREIWPKHNKIERQSQTSRTTFNISESLRDALSNDWECCDVLRAKRTPMSSCPELRRPSIYARNNSCSQTRWKRYYLTLVMKKNEACPCESVISSMRRPEVQTTLTLPCRVDQLLSKITRFEPSISGVAKKKFQAKLCHVCSCLNDLLSRMSEKMIKLTYLVCEIRADYVIFKLRRSSAGKTHSCLYSTRVTTRQAWSNYGFRKAEPRVNSNAVCLLPPSRRDATVCDDTVRQGDQNGRSEISSIEISLDKDLGTSRDADRIFEDLSCAVRELRDLNLRDSLSIDDVIKKLESSPFRLQETEQSIEIRSEIRDIASSMFITDQEHASDDDEPKNMLVSIEAIVSTESIDNRSSTRVSPDRSSPKTSGKIVSFIQSKVSPIQSTRSDGCCTNSTKSQDSAGSKRKELRKIIDRSVRSKDSSCCAKPDTHTLKCFNNSNETRQLVRSVECKRAKDSPIFPSIAQKIFDALASPISVRGDEDEHRVCDIFVTLETEDSLDGLAADDEPLRRGHRALASNNLCSPHVSANVDKCLWKNVFDDFSEASLDVENRISSTNDVLRRDNSTTMNKSMLSSRMRGTLSKKSHDRIKYLVRTKLSRNCSEENRGNSMKTIISSDNYYLSIPSAKSSIIHLRNEISQSSSSASEESVTHPVANYRRSTLNTSYDEGVAIRCFNCYSSDTDAHPSSSRAATFDKNSRYGCVDDRLANRSLDEILPEYSDEAGDSTRRIDADSRNFYEAFRDQRKKAAVRRDSCNCASTVDQRSLNGFATDDETSTDVTTPAYINEHLRRRPKNSTRGAGRSVVVRHDTPRGKDHGIARKKGRSCRKSIGTFSSSDLRKIQARSLRGNYRLRSMESQGPSRQKRSSIVEKYKKQFEYLDKSFRSKILRYFEFCKMAKTNFQKRISFDDIYDANTSLSLVLDEYLSLSFDATKSKTTRVRSSENVPEFGDPRDVRIAGYCEAGNRGNVIIKARSTNQTS